MSIDLSRLKVPGSSGTLLPQSPRRPTLARTRTIAHISMHAENHLTLKLLTKLDKAEPHRSRHQESVFIE